LFQVSQGRGFFSGIAIPPIPPSQLGLHLRRIVKHQTTSTLQTWIISPLFASPPRFDPFFARIRPPVGKLDLPSLFLITPRPFFHSGSLAHNFTSPAPLETPPSGACYHQPLSRHPYVLLTLHLHGTVSQPEFIISLPQSSVFHPSPPLHHEVHSPPLPPLQTHTFP